MQNRSVHRRICYSLLIVVALATTTPAQPSQPSRDLEWETGKTGSQASFRGISAANPDCIWLSGSGTVVLRSSNGGNSWTDVRPQGYDGVDFRCVHAFSDTVACLASAGTPAVILRTANGGESWTEVYRNDAETAFFDCMRFWKDRNGIAVSDPVGGRLLIVETSDGGRNWSPIPDRLLPTARDGEAAFAASNTSLCLGDGGQFWIGTGGTQATRSRMYHRPKYGAALTVTTVGMASAPAQGIFSLCRAGETLVCVGGDYRPDHDSAVTALVSSNGGVTWKVPRTPPTQYRSCVAPLPEELGGGFICVGPTGSEHAGADAQNWQPTSSRSFHAVTAIGDTVFACGAEGAFARLRIRK